MRASGLPGGAAGRSSLEAHCFTIQDENQTAILFFCALSILLMHSLLNNFLSALFPCYTVNWGHLRHFNVKLCVVFECFDTAVDKTAELCN